MKQILALLCMLAWFSHSAAAQKTNAKTKSRPAAAVGVVAGKTIYARNCLTCHQADGGGVDGMNPPLTNTTYVLGDKTRLVKVILNGLQDEDIDGEPYNNVMPAFDILTDQEIADVLTFVRSNFGNKASEVTAAEVKTIRTTNRK
ncbi:cytochrome c [Hymenobacter sp. 5516J-16]|uniref:c-type cytochrome n=1 Tax=Hymenobacter sp. 5516J-16 TaxID=2932253 RepID=UPI001FD36FE4|nr:cytochrome c [Hymenobacter sp. 5516J-16]UOQ77583.1 cytochrome c [Hymenobacter sp. 5516J-16]